MKCVAGIIGVLKTLPATTLKALLYLPLSAGKAALYLETWQEISY
jgi:hypothetical protein